MERPRLDVDRVSELAHTRFVKLFDLSYEGGSHYYVASRRELPDLLVMSEDGASEDALPDAVSCCLILAAEHDEPRLVLFYEYRYPTGQFVLSIPSGLIDDRDKEEKSPLVAAMTREIGEECGLVPSEGDRIWVINPLLFNSPGLTDESTALLCAVLRQRPASLSQAGAVGSECFDGFELLTIPEVETVLEQGRDPRGRPYPMVTWAAMSYFASSRWREGSRGI